MVTNDIHLSELTRRISETLQEGRLVAIIGWRDSNHNAFTRSLSSNVIKFLGDLPRAPSQNIGYILFTRFISHSLVERVKRAKEKQCYHPIPVDIGQIKKILKSCEGLLKHSIPQVQTTGTETLEHLPGSSTNPVIHDGLLDFLTQPQPETTEMNEMEKFARAFQDPANKKAGNLVSSMTLGELRRSCGVTKTNLQLITAGWIEKVEPANGKTKAFWYRPGRLMAHETPLKVTTLPETASGRAEFLISQKPGLLAEKGKLVARQKEIDDTLEMIEAAEQMFSKIDQVFNSPKPN